MKDVSKHTRTSACLHPRRIFTHFAWVIIVVTFPFAFGCGAFNFGKPLWVTKTAPDEHYYLVKDVFLSAGGSAAPRDSFDHNLHDRVSLFFVPANEKNTYVAESRWIDPDGVEYRTIRTTHDKQQEGKQGIDRSSKGTTRVHTISTQELYDHKPGEWKVELYLEGELVRRLPFSIR